MRLYGLKWGKEIGRALGEDECWKILWDFAGWFGGKLWGTGNGGEGVILSTRQWFKTYLQTGQEVVWRQWYWSYILASQYSDLNPIEDLWKYLKCCIKLHQKAFMTCGTE